MDSGTPPDDGQDHVGKRPSRQVFDYYENAMSVLNECVFKGMPTLEWMAIFGWSSPVSAQDEDESFFLLKKKAHSAVILYAKTIRAGVTPPLLTIIRKHLPPLSRCAKTTMSTLPIPTSPPKS